nr:MAG TPA: hypothetical protein [Caudoviricetes sp.]
MIFRDTIRIIEPVKVRGGVQPTGPEHTVGAIIEQAGGLRGGGFYDALAGDARAYVDTRNEWLKSIGYRLHGMYARITKHGVAKLYRVRNNAIGERFVSTGAVHHLEIELEEVKEMQNG